MAGPCRAVASNNRIATTTIPNQPVEATLMLMTIAIILIILWALGMVSTTSMGGFIHILLVVAVIMLLIRLIQGRRV